MLDVRKDIEKHYSQSRIGLYMHSSECCTPPSVQLIQASYLSYRYSHTKIENLRSGEGAFGNTRLFASLREKLESTINDKLGASWTITSPLSGMHAIVSTLQALISANTTIFAVRTEHGGHPSITPIIHNLGGIVKWIEFNSDMSIDWDYLSSYDNDNTIILVSISDSLLNNHLSKVTEGFKKTIIICDVSHSLSECLIDNSNSYFEKGADVVLGSFHKNFPGPHKGFISARDPRLIARLESCIPFLISSDQTEKLLALLISLKEFEYYSQRYLLALKENKTVFCNILMSFNISIASLNGGFGDSQQTWVMFDSQKKAREAFDRLEESGIYVNYKKIPFYDCWGLRVGFQELSLLGYKKEHIVELAYIFSNILLDNISIKSARRLVSNISYKKSPIWKSSSAYLARIFHEGRYKNGGIPYGSCCRDNHQWNYRRDKMLPECHLVFLS